MYTIHYHVENRKKVGNAVDLLKKRGAIFRGSETTLLSIRILIENSYVKIVDLNVQPGFGEKVGLS